MFSAFIVLDHRARRTSRDTVTNHPPRRRLIARSISPFPLKGGGGGYTWRGQTAYTSLSGACAYSFAVFLRHVYPERGSSASYGLEKHSSSLAKELTSLASSRTLPYVIDEVRTLTTSKHTVTQGCHPAEKAMQQLRSPSRTQGVSCRHTATATTTPPMSAREERRVVPWSCLS